MKKQRIVTVLGARPQFIKAGALSRSLKYYGGFEETIIHTGQHFDKNMSDIFFKDLEIPEPKYFLNIHGGTHGQMTGGMLSSIEEVLLKEKPDMVLVYGDTNSTLAGALAASKLHIPASHVEAGLRSFNRKMPEEINRVLTDHMSQLLFCPTQESIRNLKNEGLTEGVHHVGDVMYDATLFAKEYVAKNIQAFERKFEDLPEKFALLTIHRQESTINEETFLALIKHVETFSKENNVEVLFPVHPRIKKWVQNLGKNFQCMAPLGYFEMQYLLGKSSFVVTDSGGLQKEAYFHQVPCITLRSETEWVETIEAGWNRLWAESNYKPRKSIEDYGEGTCSRSILEILAGHK